MADKMVELRAALQGLSLIELRLVLRFADFLAKLDKGGGGRIY